MSGEHVPHARSHDPHDAPEITKHTSAHISGMKQPQNAFDTKLMMTNEICQMIFHFS